MLMVSPGCGGSSDKPDVEPAESPVRVDVRAGETRLLEALWEAGASPEIAAGQDTEVGVLTFEDADDLGPFDAAKDVALHVTAPRIDDGLRLAWGLEKSGNRIVWTCDLDAGKVTHLVLSRVRVTDSRGPAHLLWQTDEMPPSNWHHAAFHVSFDEKEHDYVIPVEDSAGWTGRVVRLALQFGAPHKKVLELGSIPVSLEAIEYRRMDLGSRRKAEKHTPSIRRLDLDRMSREVAHAPAPSDFALELSALPEKAALDFAIGVHPAAANKPGDGVEYRVTFEPEAGERVTLFEARLDPRTNPDDRKWREARVDLAKLAGQAGTLRFVTDPLGDPAYDDAVWANPRLFTAIDRTAADAGPPNLILVSLDTVRADHLGCYGYKKPTTPNIDTFAEEAFLFEKAFTTTGETVSAHMSLFTSLSPMAHGIHQIFDGKVLNENIVTFAQLLQGYRHPFVTAAFTEGGGMTNTVGFDRGFDTYSIGEIQEDQSPENPRRLKMLESTFRNATDWLRANHERRFFLFVHSYEAHTPYAPPSPYDSHFYPDYKGDIEVPITAESIELLVAARKVKYGGEGARRIESLYDGAIRYLDEHVGRLLAEVGRLGLLDNTMVILFSDHGEDFFDHFSIGMHGNSLYDEQVHVPLLIRPPGGLDAPRRIPDLVSLMDLTPTMLDRLGIGYRPLEDSPAHEGVSVGPLLDGKTMPARPVYMEDPTGFVRYAIRDGRHKRIISPNVKENQLVPLVERFADLIRLDRFEGIFEDLEVYDLIEDPDETRNLVYPEGAADRPEYLGEEIRRRRKSSEKRGKDFPARDGAAPTSGVLDRLIGLGYADEKDD